MKIRRYLLIMVMAAAILGLTACSGGVKNTPAPSAAQPATQPATQPAVQPDTSALTSGQQLFEERCSVCHSLDRAKSAKKSAADWGTTVKRMVGKGANLSESEQQAVIQFLSETYK